MAQDAGEEQGRAGQAAGFEVQEERAIGQGGDEGREFGWHDDRRLDGLIGDGQLFVQKLLPGVDEAIAAGPERFERQADAKVIAGGGLNHVAAMQEAGNGTAIAVGEPTLVGGVPGLMN